MFPLLAVTLMLSFAAPQQTGTRALVGAWEGESICTIPTSPCHNEHVIYHVKSVQGDATKFTIDADKVVNGEEEFMGTLSCVYTESKSELYCDTFGDWRFTVSGSSMTGTLNLKDGRLYRKISVSQETGFGCAIFRASIVNSCTVGLLDHHEFQARHQQLHCSVRD